MYYYMYISYVSKGGATMNRTDKKLSDMQFKPSGEKEKKKRFTFTMTPTDRKHLEELTKHYKVKSDAQMLSDLIEWAYRQIE